MCGCHPALCSYPHLDTQTPIPTPPWGPRYAFQVALYQDGTIAYEVKLTGCLSTSILSEGEAAPTNGTLLSPGLNAQIHQHFFCTRIDMAVDDEHGGDGLSVTEVPTLLILTLLNIPFFDLFDLSGVSYCLCIDSDYDWLCLIQLCIDAGRPKTCLSNHSLIQDVYSLFIDRHPWTSR